MLLKNVAVNHPVVWFGTYPFPLVEFCDCHEGIALFFHLRDEHLEGFHCVVIALEVMQKDDVAVFESVDQNVVSFLCCALRDPVFAAYAADECVPDGLMH